MQDWLSARAQATPHKIGLIASGKQWTFAEMDQFVSSIHVESGQHIAFIATNQPETVFFLFALMRAGSIAVPLNARLTPEEIDYQVKNADAKLVDVASQADAQKRVPTGFDLNERFAIVHTSGTSGRPKGAVLTYGNIFYSAMASAYRLGHSPDDKWLCTLPLYHVGGISILIRACLYGITVDLRERFEMEAVNYALTHENITLISLVPTMLYRLLDYRQQPWSDALRLVLLGGAAASPQLMQRCLDENIPVATTYGLSEAASQVATATPDIAMHKPGTVGKPLMFTQVRIEKDNPTDEYGEIVVKGQTVMEGYYNNPDTKTLRDGWLYTGDIGYLDDEGDLWLVQRRSDLIVTGGENVYPTEVENVLRSHPAVKDVAVVGVDDPEWGQRVAAAVQLEQSLTEDELIAYSREHLAGYKQPRQIIFVDELPQTGSGKIERKGVRKLFR